MKLVGRILLITFLLNTFLGLRVAQQDAHAQKLNLFTEMAFKYFKTGDYKSAVLELKQAVQWDPEDAFAWFLLGMSYASLKEWKDSAEAYRKSLSLNPNPLWWGKVNEKMVRGALAEAEQNARATRVKPVLPLQTPQELVQKPEPERNKPNDQNAEKPRRFGNWDVEKEIDPMTDKASCTALYRGKPYVQLSLGAFFIGMRGRGSVEAITLRFDDNPPRTMRLPSRLEKEIGAVQFTPEELNNLLYAKRLRVQVLTLLGSLVNEDLDLTGTQDAWSAVRACE